jgi:hypothetical protein
MGGQIEITFEPAQFDAAESMLCGKIQDFRKVPLGTAQRRKGERQTVWFLFRHYEW